MEAEVRFTPQGYSRGFTISISPEESHWLQRINRYPLWFRYAPNKIKDNTLILMAYQIAKCRQNDWSRYV